MATFKQQGQSVKKQYNAETINFGEAKSADEFQSHLKALQTEIRKAIDTGAIPEDVAIDAEYQLKKASLQAEQPAPDKNKLLAHLSSAKNLISDVSGLATALAGAITAVGALF